MSSQVQSMSGSAPKVREAREARVTWVQAAERTQMHPPTTGISGQAKSRMAPLFIAPTEEQSRIEPEPESESEPEALDCLGESPES